MAKILKLEHRTNPIGIIIRIGVVIAIIIIGFLLWKKTIWMNQVVFENRKIASELTGLKVVHVTDILNSSLNLSGTVKRADPDLVIISGDIANYKGKYGNAVKQIKKIAEKYPVAFIDGDNDQQVLDSILSELDVANIYYLGDESMDFDVGSSADYDVSESEEIGDDKEGVVGYAADSRKTTRIKIVGIPDYIAAGDPLLAQEYLIDALGVYDGAYSIAVVHRVEAFEALSKCNVDMIVSGNTLGNKPNGSDYGSGFFGNQGTTLVVSSGIGQDDGTVTNRLRLAEIYSIKLSDGSIKNKNPLEKLIYNIIGDVETRLEGQEHEITTYKYEKGKEEIGQQ